MAVSWGTRAERRFRGYRLGPQHKPAGNGAVPAVLSKKIGPYAVRKNYFAVTGLCRTAIVAGPPCHPTEHHDKAIATEAPIAGASLRPQARASAGVSIRSWRTSSEQCGRLRGWAWALSVYS